MDYFFSDIIDCNQKEGYGNVRKRGKINYENLDGHWDFWEKVSESVLRVFTWISKLI
jgi:hypothetical protein